MTTRQSMATTSSSNRKKVCPKRFAATGKRGPKQIRTHGKPPATTSGAPFLRRSKHPIAQGRSSDLSPEAAPSRSRRTSGSRMPQRKSPCGRDSQQRELLPIHTAFPFNSPPRGNHCTAKIRFYRQEASDPAEYFRETRPAALRSGPFRPRCVPFPADGGATLARALYLFQSTAAQQPQ